VEESETRRRYREQGFGASASVSGERPEPLRGEYRAPEVVKLFTKHPPVQEDSRTELDRVAAKTLIVWGAEDRAGALKVGVLMLRRFRDVELHVFNKTGHSVQLERPREFSRLVLDFRCR